ncbi:MAG: prepilin-type N-terminal cleavage/methylation domain-containing protein [Candidatus Gracilibacteria bacterium]|nr:prepilin-type N-terminal cleavage/methylation domain-containing protein [Candidatus Gracilibacteria bacterium]
MHPTPNNKSTDVIFQHPHHKQMKNFLGFTLIELIVVITILVIPGTIAFLNLGGFQSSARDSSRVENLSNLKKGLDVFQIKTGSYPVPENIVSVTASGITIGYQGFAKELTERTIGLSVGGTRDPLDTSIYTTYSVNADRTKMELMNFLEDGSTLLSLNAFVPNASADIGSDYSKRYPSVQGDTLGILLGNSGTTLNQPIQESGTGVDVVKTNSGYVAVFGKGDSISGSGNTLFTTLYNRRDDLLKIKTLASLDSSLVGYWDMEATTLSGSQMLLKDWSGYGNNGKCTKINNNSQVSCKDWIDTQKSVFNGNGKEVKKSFINFNGGPSGNRDALVINKDFSFLHNSSFTFVIGHNPKDYDDERLFNSYYWSGVNIMNGLNIGNNYFQIGDGTVGKYISIPFNVNDLSYQYLTVVIDRTKDEVGFYKNGTKISTYIFTTPKLNWNNIFIGNMFIGGGYGTPNSYSVNEARIYSRALSDLEIQALYSATK